MADKTINIRLRQKYDTEANWTSKNPVLLAGEMAVSSDKNGQFKVGNGTSTWSQLSYNQIPWTSVTGRPSALKNPAALSIKLNGVAQDPYDGSVARTINVTAASVGAAATSHTHSYLPLSGGTLTGLLGANKGISIPTVGSSWIGGMTATQLITFTGNSTGSYHPMIRYVMNSGNVANLGALGNNMGFYGYKNGRTENGTDCYAYLDTANNRFSATKFYGPLEGNATTATTATAASKLGTATVGSATKPFYLNAGVPTAFSSTIGATNKPMFLNAGTLTACSANVGSSSVPVYMTGGAIAACTSLSLNTTGSAAKWTTARNFVIGNKTISLDGSKNVLATLAEIGAAPSTATRLLTATATASGWSASAPYSQTISVSGITSSDTPVIGLSLPTNTTSANEKLIKKAYGCLSSAVTNNGSITLYCAGKKPVTNFTIFIKGV